MSGYLWKYYLEDDVDAFRRVLEGASYNTRPSAQKGFAGWQGGNLTSSPGSLGTSPAINPKGRKLHGLSGINLTRSDINSRDATGQTILHHAASSKSDNATAFAQALLEHPLIDLYVQDAENGWTALHRAFYFGNIAIGRLILNRDTGNILGHGASGFGQNARGLVKIKDKEGYGPLDLFALTIKDRPLGSAEASVDDSDSDNDDGFAHGDSGDRDDGEHRRLIRPPVHLSADEVFTFGSNKNVTLGFGDEDDRQFPERIILRRPDHLAQRFHREYRRSQNQKWASMNLALHESGFLQPKAATDLPTIIRNTPIVVQDVQMSKLHTAILTTDPESNLYMCGHGPGGRLGTGNETTRYQFTCIDGGALARQKVAAIALGQNHTLALSDEGEIYSWGNNAYGQLGYTLPKPNLKDDDPLQTLPRQIYGPLKREIIVGIAASRIHSVAHSETSLYTFGKNEGQLGIIDSDARSLEMQIIPRKIAASLFSSSILSVSAIDGATTCLLENREVWVFANYGYARVAFPLDGFTNYFLKESWLTTKYDTTPNRISKITSGGDTICAMSSSGEVFTVAVSKRSEASSDAGTSTTNPKQIRGALSQPYRIWSAKKGHMAARDVDVDQDGSVILTTDSGTVWRRMKRATIKNATASGTGEYKPKDYKFQRVSGLTRVVAVRASAFGAYAAIRKDCDVTKTQVGVDEPSLWNDIAPLLPFHDLARFEEDSEDEDPEPRFWQSRSHDPLRKRVLRSKDLEAEVKDILRTSDNDDFDLEVATAVSEVRIPVHQFVLAGRSPIIRQGLAMLSNGGDFSIPEMLTAEHNAAGKTTLMFQGLDFLTIFNLVLYAYTDSVVDFWNLTRQFPTMAFRYRSVRTELMKVASRLEFRQLEAAARQMISPKRSLNYDLELAIKDPSFFDDGDVIVELADGEVQVHSAIFCQRCPFFEGLFRGRAGGQWLAGRREEDPHSVRVDLKHIEQSLFEIIVRHVYSDAGEELFENVASEDLNDLLALDEFVDHVMDIMGIANELMLDRLSQICQRLIGRYVNARNVCQLLNAISPSSVVEFKDAALEYVCLSMEAVMQNGSLDELDEDLLFELNQVVRDNQLAYLPFARSGRAEALLFDKYPELAERIERGKRAKVDAIVLSNKFPDNDGAISTSFRAQSLEELSASPLKQKARRRSSAQAKAGFPSPASTPALKGKASVADLMFEMSDDDSEGSPSRRKSRDPEDTDLLDDLNDVHTPGIGSPQESWSEVRRKSRSLSHGLGLDEATLPQTTSPDQLRVTQGTRPPGRPWGPAPLTHNKLDLKDIMAQTSSDTPSGLSIGLSKQPTGERAAGSFNAKISQKERKKLQQAQQLGPPGTPQSKPAAPTVSPWQAMSSRKITPSGSPAVAPSPPARSTTPQLTMRQTVAGSGAGKQKAQQQQQSQQNPSRSVSNPSNIPSRPSPSAAPTGTPASSSNAVPAPRSIRHMPMPSHSLTSPSQGLSMLEILSLQQAEKQSIRDAAAKRSLQEIQQEQEFQEWWDAESKRVIQEEEDRKRVDAREKSGRGRSKGRGGKRGGSKAKGKKDGEGEGVEAKAASSTSAQGQTAPPPGPKRGGGDRARGRGYRGGHRGGDERGGRQGHGKDAAAASASGSAAAM